MRITLLVSILFCSFNAMSQKDDKQKEVSAIIQTIDKIDFLDSLELWVRKINIHSASLIYSSYNTEDKENLHYEVNIYPSEYLKGLKINLSKAEADSIENEFLVYLLHSKNNMDSLRTFEDYYDEETEETTEKYKVAEATLINNIQVSHNALINLIVTAKKKQEDNLYKLFEGKSSHIPYESIRNQYYIVKNVKAMNKMTWELFYGVFSWVYLPMNFQEKAELRNNLNTNYEILQYKLQVINEFEINYLLEQLLPFRVHIESVTNSLITKDDYEDPLTKLLAEDAIDSEILPSFIEVSPLVENLSKKKQTELKFLLSGNLDKKTEDIKKMIKFSYASERIFLTENNEINIDELVTELIPIYAKRYSHKEILEIIKFQESKIGKKVRKNSPDIMSESLQIIARYLERTKANN